MSKLLPLKLSTRQTKKVLFTYQFRHLSHRPIYAYLFNFIVIGLSPISLLKIAHINSY